MLGFAIAQPNLQLFITLLDIVRIGSETLIYQDCTPSFSRCLILLIDNCQLLIEKSWWTDLNRRPAAYKADALPLSYTSRFYSQFTILANSSWNVNSFEEIS